MREDDETPYVPTRFGDTTPRWDARTATVDAGLSARSARSARASEAGDLTLTTSVPVYPQREIVGLSLDACTMAQMVETVEAWVDEGRTRTAAGVNANVVNMVARDPGLRQLFAEHDVRYADGQSIVWASRLLGLDVPERVATTDLIHPLAEMCGRRGFRMFLLGGKEVVVQRAAEVLMSINPGLEVSVQDGYFGPEDNDDVLAAINASGARVLLVGMGDPMQQEWLHAHRERLAPEVLLTCGGLFDWVSGKNARPPRWLVSLGLEWLWRIYLEPRRLAGRYILGNPEFIARLMLAMAKRPRRSGRATLTRLMQKRDRRG